MAAVAVLLVNSVMNVPTRHIPARAIIGLPLHTERIPFEMHSAIPVSCMAVPRLMLPAKIISKLQSMLSRACLIVQKRQIIIANAATNAIGGILLKGVTVWRDPTKIGTVGIYDNI